MCEWEYVCVCVCACVSVFIRDHEREERESVREREGKGARERETCVGQTVCMSPRATALEFAKKRKRWSMVQAQKRRQRRVWAGVEIDTVVLSGRHCVRVEEKMAQTSPEVASLLVPGMHGAKKCTRACRENPGPRQALHGRPAHLLDEERK